ncbi:MAG TPA: lysylphosphatidylglycerol synthase transmembrane domain-containing protein [Xanthobacteraceae bacterium]|nr:lysylphosphatidylglycerol synthase transmembrane domain-containing protein [Xanthobacteraceae bacterium]
MLHSRGVRLLTRVGLLILKILVVVLIGWVFWPQFRWNEFAEALARTSAPTALTVLTLFWFQAVMAALRWRWILHRLGYPLTTGASVEAWLVGQCASQILPAVVGGDAARIIRLRRYQVPTADALVSVVIDRFAGFVALVVLSAFTVPMLTAYNNMLIPDEIFWALGISCLLVAILLLSLRWTANAPALRRIPQLAHVQAALRAVHPTKEGLLLFALIGLGTNMTVIISAFLLGRELNPLMDLYSCFAILPLVSLLTFIPISIAGWGVREALMMSAFALIDVPATDALAVSIKLGLANLALGVIGGIVWIVLPAKEIPGELSSEPVISHSDRSA